VSQRPAPLRSALPRGPEAVIKPETTPAPTLPKTGKTGSAGNTGKAGKAGSSGKAGNTGSAGTSGALHKLTARIDKELVGRCQAAYMHALLTDPNAAPTFEAWVIGALEDKLKRAEKKNGAPFMPIAALPRGRKPRA
jgi:hypothetical protein